MPKYVDIGFDARSLNTGRIRHNEVKLFSHDFIRYKGKAVPLEAWSGPQGSRKLRFQGFMTTAHDGRKVVSLMHRPPLPPKKYTWYSFLLEAKSTPGS